MAKRLAGVFFTLALLMVVFVGFLVPSEPGALPSAPSVILDPYGPPYKTDGYNPDGYKTDGSCGVRINIETRGLGLDYTQLGILTRTGDLILPLMGRRLMSGLDRWQYYTISNTGTMNTKLPITAKGRSCSGEYGCEALMNRDTVFVEGYNDTFTVTLYETAKYNYIPYV